MSRYASRNTGSLRPLTYSRLRYGAWTAVRPPLKRQESSGGRHPGSAAPADGGMPQHCPALAPSRPRGQTRRSAGGMLRDARTQEGFSDPSSS
jgi:hypothetical protein